jgi:hypothetical protein
MKETKINIILTRPQRASQIACRELSTTTTPAGSSPSNVRAIFVGTSP